MRRYCWILFWMWACLPHGVWAQEGESCVESCVRNHSLFRFPGCSQMGPELAGPDCYEVYNSCLQGCGVVLREVSEYAPSPNQVEDQWKQAQVCRSTVQRFPFETASGAVRIDSQWSGYCECLNGRLLLAPCGHRRTSCNQACSGKKSF